MATFNGERFLKEQIESILSQLNDHDELIISDDCSSDLTKSIISDFDDIRIKLINHVPQGANAFEKAKANFENALSHAKGDYIFLSDQDDIWCDNKIESIVPLLDKYGCVQHGKYEMYPDKCEPCKPLSCNHNIVSGIMSMHFAGCCMGITKDFLNKALPIPKSVITHDGWLACYAISLKTYCYTNKSLLFHRVHGENVSIGKRNNIWYRLKYRFILLLEILKRNYIHRK